jgi:kinesin family protein 18/19
MEQLHRGNLHRATEATNCNETSSRSHAVLQVVVEQKDKYAATTAAVKIGKLSMIDLAGSERAMKTGNKGVRLLEGAKINRSLLALANCINALADQTKAKKHIPFRDSKLTRLLKDSLGGNCRTVMIANVSPSRYVFLTVCPETVCPETVCPETNETF